MSPPPRHRAPRTRRTPGRVLVVGPAVGLGLGLVLAAAQSEAFWTADVAADSSGSARATSVLDGPTPATTLLPPSGMRVSWPAAHLADGTPVTRYEVTRVDPAGRTVAATGGCTGVVSGTSCTETGVPDGRWTYRVTSRSGSWSGAPGAAGPAVLADATPPAQELSVVVDRGGAVLDASTVWFRGAREGSLRVVDALTDGGSGPALSRTSAVTARGWTHPGGAATGPRGGPYTSAPVTWADGTVDDAELRVTGEDAHGNAATTVLALRRDDDPPVGGEVSTPDGATTSTRLTIGTAPSYDAGSGLASRSLEQSEAPLRGNVCGAYDGWTQVAAEPAAGHDEAVEIGRCYRYRHLATDRVGNVATRVGEGVAKVRSYAAVVTATPGLVGYWRLGEPGGGTVTAVRGPAGSYGGGPGLGATGALAGDPDTAVGLDGRDDHAVVARQVAGSFSVELWFRADGGGRGVGDWTTGAVMADTTATSFLGLARHGFGLALGRGGTVLGGTVDGFLASPRTVTSGPGHADGRWHHVVLTRDGGTGVVELYVDGASAGRTVGPTGPLDRAGDLSLGRLRAGGGHLAGELDEVAVYDRVLPADTVDEHHLSGRP